MLAESAEAERVQEEEDREVARADVPIPMGPHVFCAPVAGPSDRTFFCKPNCPTVRFSALLRFSGTLAPAYRTVQNGGPNCPSVGSAAPVRSRGTMAPSVPQRGTQEWKTDLPDGWVWRPDLE